MSSRVSEALEAFVPENITANSEDAMYEVRGYRTGPSSCCVMFIWSDSERFNYTNPANPFLDIQNDGMG